MSESPIYKMIDKIFDEVIEKFYANQISRDESIRVVSRYIELSKQVDLRLTGKGHNSLGFFYFASCDYRSALKQFEQAKDVFAQATHYEGISSALSNIGEVNRKLGTIHRRLTHMRQHWHLPGKKTLKHLRFSPCVIWVQSIWIKVITDMPSTCWKKRSA